MGNEKHGNEKQLSVVAVSCLCINIWAKPQAPIQRHVNKNFHPHPMNLSWHVTVFTVILVAMSTGLWMDFLTQK